MVRLDAYLKNVGLFKSRSQAKRCIDDGRACVQDRIARGSQGVHIGDRLRIETDTQLIEGEVLDVPVRPVARARRSDCFRIDRNEPMAAEILSFDDDA